jgi:isopenicillin-N epimerase
VKITRRTFLKGSGSVVAVGLLSGMAAGERDNTAAPANDLPRDGWEAIRAQFDLDPNYIHLSALLLASNPQPVRESIARYRQLLDNNPALYVEENRMELERATRRAAARYLGVDFQGVALTDSTTMGLGLVYGGVRVRQDQELLTTDQDYYSTHQALRYKRRDSGAEIREIPLFESASNVSEDEIVETLARAIRPQTRLVALTWVHSKTGLKLPVRRIADELARLNAGRDEADQALLGIDGVHGLGVEDFTMDDLGCDFFMAGTHKWLFGPRGTGIAWGKPGIRSMVNTLIPTFTPDGTWGGRMTPGGFKPFEHQWAISEAFEFHQQIGKAQVAARIHALCRQCKEGLARMDHVTLHTPLAENLSSGIVCFDVDGLTPLQVVERLLERRIVANVTPYTPPHARLTPSIINTPAEIETTLAAIYDLG